MAPMIKEKTPFCAFADVHLPESSGKEHPHKLFLAVGPKNVITPLLQHLKGAKKLLASGFCSLEKGKIELVVHERKLEPALVKSHAAIFKDIFGREVLLSAGGDDNEHQPGAAHAAEPAHPAPPVAPHPAAAAPAANIPQHPKLTQAALHWDGTKTMVDGRVKELVRAVKSHYSAHGPDLLKEIDKSMLKIDATLAKLDHRLTNSLKAAASVSGPAHEAEIKKTRAIVEEFKHIVKSERLIAHIDQNPFGVKTNLQASLMESLTKAEQLMV
ncbi:MAG TPA: hypothetical protein VHW09_22400 [Bryobacteraceae bacterium]|nr:hypothetical protein [Bryobacteraceae bacterium]